MSYFYKMAQQTLVRARAKQIVKHALDKLAAKPEEAPKFENIAEPPSADPIEPPKAPKAFTPPKLKFGPQSHSGTTDGALANNR